MKLNNNDDSHNSGLNLLIYNMLLDIESHPAWVCGLKLGHCIVVLFLNLSHPAWVCGLKQYRMLQILWGEMSHPAWVCGLKPSWEAARAARPVTPCVGVWIETENN